MKHLFFLLSGMVVLLLPERTWAHALRATWEIKGDRVEVEAFFTDGTLAQKAVVRVIETNRDSVEQTVLESKTDDNGVCSFAVPKPGTYRIVVDAGAGHRTELLLSIRLSPAEIRRVLLVLGAASLGGLENLGIGPTLAEEYREGVAQDKKSVGPGKEDLTSYPWGSVIIAVGCLAIVALVFWLLRGAAGS